MLLFNPIYYNSACYLLLSEDYFVYFEYPKYDD